MKSADKSIRLSILSAIAMIVQSVFPPLAAAHVKWFVPYDVRHPPLPLTAVVTPMFLYSLMAFLVLIFLAYLVDGWIARHRPAVLSSGGIHARTEENLLRLLTGAFFLCTWATGGIILTPELHSDAFWVNLLHAGIAAAMIWRRTCVLGGIGILVLYGDGIAQYGLFHMVDYVFLPAIAVYLMLVSAEAPWAERVRTSLLSGGLAFSLIWTAVEKLVYPGWTYEVIAEYPNLAFGLPPAFVTMVAGLVEFSLAFHLATGRGLLRLGGVALMAVFLAAIPEFGKIDAVGHLMICAVIGIVCLRGTSALQDALRWHGRSVAVDAGLVCVLYLATLGSVAAMYYGLQLAEYG